MSIIYKLNSHKVKNQNESTNENLNKVDKTEDLEKKKLSITGIFNSDDLDASKEYCKKQNVDFEYDGNASTMIFTGSASEIKKIKKLYYS